MISRPVFSPVPAREGGEGTVNESPGHLTPFTGDKPMSEIPPRTQSLASCYENALTIILRLSSLH